MTKDSIKYQIDRLLFIVFLTERANKQYKQTFLETQLEVLNKEIKELQKQLPKKKNVKKKK